MIDLETLTEVERKELMRQMLNAYTRQRYHSRTEEQKAHDRKRKREYMREYRKRQKAKKEQTEQQN